MIMIVNNDDGDGDDDDDDDDDDDGGGGDDDDNNDHIDANITNDAEHAHNAFDFIECCYDVVMHWGVDKNSCLMSL